MRPSIDETMIEIAMTLSARGSCMKKQVGCVITDKHGYILGTGYNGQPRGHQHCDDAFPCEAFLDGNVSCKAIHAEMNALMRCRDIETAESIYVTESPCLKCRLLISNTPIHRLITPDETTFHILKIETVWP
jgi:dCMP deaminase